MDIVYAKLSAALTTELYNLDKEIDDLYKRRDELVKSVIAKSKQPLEGSFKIEADEKPFKRVRVVDNLEEIASGKTLFRSAGFSRFSVEISHLKHEPKSNVVEEKPVDKKVVKAEKTAVKKSTKSRRSSQFEINA